MIQLKILTRDKMELTINNFDGDMEMIAVDLLDKDIPFLFLPQTILAKDNILTICEIDEGDMFNRQD